MLRRSIVFASWSSCHSLRRTVANAAARDLQFQSGIAITMRCAVEDRSRSRKVASFLQLPGGGRVGCASSLICVMTLRNFSVSGYARTTRQWFACIAMEASDEIYYPVGEF